MVKSGERAPGRFTYIDVDVIHVDRLKSYNHMYMSKDYSQFSISLPAYSKIRP